MPAKKLPTLSAEDCDLLADCICLVEMFTDYLTAEQSKRLKKFVADIWPRKRHRPRSELEPFLAMIESQIKAGLSVNKSCTEVGSILREDPKRLRSLLYAARRRR
jgi:hypothetical protein